MQTAIYRCQICDLVESSKKEGRYVTRPQQGSDHLFSKPEEECINHEESSVEAKVVC